MGVVHGHDAWALCMGCVHGHDAWAHYILTRRVTRGMYGRVRLVVVPAAARDPPHWAETHDELSMGAPPVVSDLVGHDRLKGCGGARRGMEGCGGVWRPLCGTKRTGEGWMDSPHPDELGNRWVG